MFSLDGKFAVVTGASGRLGSLWAVELAKAGAIVRGIDLRDSSLYWSGDWENQEIPVYACDVTSEQQVVALRRPFGPIDILVNAHGLDAPPGAGIVRETAMVEVNFYGTVNTCRGFRPQPGGAIVNVSSLYAIVSPDKRVYDHIEAPPHCAPSDRGWNKPPFYGASKAAVVAWSRQMATQWARDGVRVNCLTLGGVRHDQDREFVRKYSERVPMGRMAEPEDTVGPLLFLASDASRYMTGQNLIVDGGYSAW